MNATSSNQPPAPRKSWLKSLLKIFVAFVCGFAACALLVFLFLLVTHLRARYELNSWKAEMIVKGEKFFIGELAPPPVPPEKNDLILRHVSEQLVAAPIAPSDLCGFSFAAPGQARVIWKNEFPVPNKTELTWSQLERQMEQSASALRQIRAALEKPPELTGQDYRNPWEGPNFIWLRKTSQWLAAAAMNDLHHNRRDDALENLVTFAALPRSYWRAPSLVNQMIRSAVCSVGVAAVWQALQASDWNEAQLARLQSAWQEIEIASHFEKSVQLERAELFNHFGALRKSLWDFEQKEYEMKKQFAINTGEPEPAAPRKSLLERFIYFPAWKFLHADRDELFLLQSSQPEMDLMRPISHMFNGEPILKFNGSKEVIPAIRVDNEPIGQVIRMLAQQAAIKFFNATNGGSPITPTFAPGDETENIRVSIYWANITAEQALEALLDAYSLALYADPVAKIVRIAPKENWLMATPVDDSVSEIPKTPKGEELISNIRFDSLTRVKEAIHVLAQQMEMSVLFDPVVERSESTLELNESNVTIRAVLEKILSENGLVLKCDPKTKLARVTTKKPPPPLHPAVRFSWPQFRDRLNEERLKAQGKISLLKPDGHQHFFPTEYLPIGYSRAIATLLHNETQREMMLAAIALKRYELRHKKLPPTLAALVPEILSHMPRDYMSGESLRYKLKSDGSYVLYSVGDDSVDNGGEINPADGKEMWDGRDALWPSAVR